MKKLFILLSCLVFSLTVFAQSIDSVDPAVADAGQTLNVTVTGSNAFFTQGSPTSLYFEFDQGSPTVINTMVVVNDDRLDANITIPANTFEGDYDVTVFNGFGGNLTLPDGFHVNGTNPPFLLSIDPVVGNAGQTLDVTITGSDTHFDQASGTIVVFEFEQASSTVVNTMNIVNNTTIDLNITIPSDTYTGSYDVYTYDIADGVLDLTDGFFVNGINPPQITDVDPDIGNAGQTLDVTITGSDTHFDQASGTLVYFEFDQASSTAINSIDIVNNTTIDVNLTIPVETYTGSYDVYTYDVTDGFIGLIDGFYVNGIDPPAIIDANPNSGQRGQTLNVTITGSDTHFAQGSGTLSAFFEFNQASGTTIYANNINDVNNESTVVNITIPSNASLGTYDFYMYNQTDGSLFLDDAFEVGDISIEHVKSEIIIYPNPFSDRIYIQTEKNIEAIELFDIKGRKLLSTRNREIDMKKYSKGIYIIRVKTEGEDINKVIFKQ